MPAASTRMVHARRLRVRSARKISRQRSRLLPATRFPTAEVSEDGTTVVTKAPGTGGRVSFDTLRQQLLYEVHNPHAYYSPDVVLDMGTLNFDDKGNDEVRITGAGGAKRPDTLKVVAGYHDGWMGLGQIGF